MEKRNNPFKPGTHAYRYQQIMLKGIEEINKGKRPDWRDWFKDLGIPKEMWKDPRGWFLKKSNLIWENSYDYDEYIDKRNRFEQMIERKWMVNRIAENDRVDTFWHYLLLNYGMTFLWYDKQNIKTKKFQEAHRLINRAYTKVREAEKKTKAMDEQIREVKKEMEIELAEISPPFPVFPPMDQYDEPHRPPDKGFLEFISNFVGLLKGIKDITDVRIYRLISLFFDCYMGLKYKPSIIKKAYLRSQSL